MSLYTAIRYINYRLHAKTRHGVHSPFVYSFIEQVLMDKTALLNDTASLVYYDMALLPGRYHSLLQRIYNYCQPHTIWIIPITEAEIYTRVALHGVQSNDVVILPHIHTSLANTQSWAAIRNSPTVRLSIDLYEIGLLFFREDFKVQQHFMLKY